MPAVSVVCSLQVDPCVAHHLWVLVFPIVWATLQKQQQINLAKPIISLLSKEYHQRQAMARPNVVQVIVTPTANKRWDRNFYVNSPTSIVNYQRHRHFTHFEILRSTELLAHCDVTLCAASPAAGAAGGHLHKRV
jgi:hypothetical protein